MITNEIIELLKKYKLIDDSTKPPSDWNEKHYDGDNSAITEVLFGELLEDKFVGYALDIGGWDEDDLVGEFAHTIKEYESASGGAIKIENFKTINPVDENGEEDEDECMTIEFDHNNKHYHWEFTMEEPGDYFKDITEWAYKALNGNVLFFGDETFSAFCIPKDLVSELKKYGVESASSKNYFG